MAESIWWPAESVGQRRRRETEAQIEDLRARALGLERQAVADRKTDWNDMGSYAQMLRESGADDLEKQALALRRHAAELESNLR